MEYGLRIGSLESLADYPADAQVAGFRERFPGARFSALYFGSEFCQELIPDRSDAGAYCAHCAENGLQAVLLTPLVTRRGLERLRRLLDGLAGQRWFPAVVFNDWGVFELLRDSHPDLPRRMGRLMNRGLRDPRLEMQPAGANGENTRRGAGLRKLAASLGVTAVETDADLEPGFLGGGDDGLERTLHLPYTFASSGRNCLEKAAAATDGKGVFTRGLQSGCAAPCRGLSRRETRTDTPRTLWRAGNTLFFEAPDEWVSRHLEFADRVVFHERPLP